MNNKKKFALILGLGVSINAMANTELNGDWQIQDADTAAKGTVEAIEGVVKEMNFFVRGIARSRLEEETQLCQQWSLTLAEQIFTWQCAAGAQWTVSTHSDTELKGDDGRAIHASVKQIGQDVSVTLRSERGTRTHIWEQQGDTVIYRSILESEKLPKPLEWSLKYQRASQ